MSYSKELTLDLFETLLRSPTELKEKLEYLKKYQEQQWLRDLEETEREFNRIDKLLKRGTNSLAFDELKRLQNTLKDKIKFLQDRISGVPIWDSIVNPKKHDLY